MSNVDPRFTRVRVRRELLPLLEQIRPGARAALLRSARLLDRDYQYVSGKAARWLERLTRLRTDDAVYLDATDWRRLHPALQAYVLRQALRGLDPKYLLTTEAIHVERGLELVRTGTSGKRVRLSADTSLTLDYTLARIGPERPGPVVAPTVLRVPGRTDMRPTGWRIQVRRTREDRATKPLLLGESWSALLDAERVPWPLLVRAWRPGDRIQPAEFSGHRKLQDVLTDLKVPQRLRPSLPLLVAGEEIAWVPNYRVAEWARTRPTTRERLAIRVTTLAGELGTPAREVQAVLRLLASPRMRRR